MVKDEVLKRADGITPPFYHLKSHPKAYNIFNYQHEKIAADIYVALNDYLDYWGAFNQDPEFLSVGLKYDRASRFYREFGGERAIWEIDRSTMVRTKIIAKVEKYIKFANRYNREFKVIIACSNRRAKSLISVLTPYRHHLVWFYTVDFNELINNPTGEIFNSITQERVPLLARLPSADSDLIQQVTG